MKARTSSPRFRDHELQEKLLRDSVYLSVNDNKLIVFQALDFAKNSHKGQTRDDGTEYIVHPIRVTRILLDEFKITDPSVLAAALLHDVVEDCAVPKKEISERFGARIALMVGALSKNLYKSNEDYHINLRSEPTDVRMIKIADRIDNLRNTSFNTPEQGWSKDKVERYLKETEDFVLPLTVGLGDEPRMKLNVLVRELREKG